MSDSLADRPMTTEQSSASPDQRTQEQRAANGGQLPDPPRKRTR